MKSCSYLVTPERRILNVEPRIPSREFLEALFGANAGETLDCAVLSEAGDRDLVLIRRTVTESLNEAGAYRVAGHRTIGKSLICTRPKNAPPIELHLTSDPLISHAPISIDEATAMIQWDAPVSAELAGRKLDVQALDAFAKWFSNLPGLLAYGHLVRVHGIDKNGRGTLSFNCPAGDWYAFRRACLDLLDRGRGGWNVCMEFVLREMPRDSHTAEETPVEVELATFSAKQSAETNIDMVSTEGKTIYGVVHSNPITDPEILARRKFAQIAVPGLPWVKADGHTVLPDWHMNVGGAP